MRLIPDLEDLTIENFISSFHNILAWKRKRGWKTFIDNPEREELLKHADFYGERYANGSVGWSSNIWSRSKRNTDVVEDNDQLTDQHKFMMRSALEYVLAPNPLIKTDGIYGQHKSVRFHCRVWTDSKYPDLALRWKETTFLADPENEPDMEALMLPGLWTPATMPGSDGKTPMFVIRFPEHWFTLGTVSSYMGEWKKMALTHWIYHVYLHGGIGVHAGSKQFTVKDVNGEWKDIGMVIWGLTGSGKSTHGMYIFNKDSAKFYVDRRIDVLSLVKNQHVKNDDIVGLFANSVRGSEFGAWTKTEDLDENQVALYMACMSPRAYHENTDRGSEGKPDFLSERLQYRGMPNKNSRTVLYLQDMGRYFDGSIDIKFPPNMAVFISPGYLTDYAWLRIADANFAAATLAAGRTVGHPAQSAEGVGEEKYVALYNPFIVGKRAKTADHVHRFLEFKLKRDAMLGKTGKDTLECYLINTTGRVGTEYETKNGVPKPIFQKIDGKKKPVGGTGPTIQETEIFLLQAARGAIGYESHPFWKGKVLVPKKVPGIPEKRLRELNPFNHRSEREMGMLLKHQIKRTKEELAKQVPGLRKEIATAMDF